MPGRELKLSIGAGQRSHETSMQKTTGVDHDHAGSVAIGMAIDQPEELRRFASSTWGKYRPGGKYMSPGPCRSSSESGAGTAWGEMRSYTPRTNPTPAAAAAFQVEASRRAKPRPLAS
jgi:hypothetical protein